MKNLKTFTLIIGLLFGIQVSFSQCQAGFTYINNGNGNISFTNTSTGTFTTSWWDFGDGTTSWWPPNSHTFPYNGTYYVCLSIADTASSCFNTFCDSITITSSNTTCLTTATSNYNGILSYNFSSYNTGVSPYTYFWNFGDGSTSTQASPYYTYTTNGSYNVFVIVTDANGCISSDTITINSTCTAGYTYTNNGSGNYSFSSVMNNSSTNYYWDFGDNTTSTLSSPTHTFSNNGPYMVCLTVTDSVLNCTATYCDSVNIFGTGNINCNFAYGANQGVPNGPTFNFWQSSNGSAFFWDFGDGTTSTQANPNHTYLTQGTYTYCLTVDSCPMVCGSVTAYNCLSNFYYYPDSLNIFDVIVINTATGNNLTYLWDFGDGVTSTQQYPQHTYATTGNYYLCLTINNGNGCIDMFCDSINASGINKQEGFSINIISPTATSIEENIEQVSGLNIYPNPFKNNLTIEFNLTEQVQVEVFITNLLGNTIAQISNNNLNVGNNQLKWNAKSLSNGIYLLHIKTNNSLQVKKLILNK